MTRHGQLYQRDMVPPRSKYYNKGKFGRLFPSLPPFMPDTAKMREALLELGKPGGIMDPGNAQNPDNLNIPAGFTFLGQFIDHDLTFDPTSSLERQNDPESIDNFRTPMFELDNVYGSGLAASPHLYDSSRENSGKFLIDAGFPKDVPRNSQNTALIGDPRNDENLIVSQLHFAFLKFHNAIIDKLKTDPTIEPSQVFAETQRLVRWHYQWIVLHEFLPHILGKTIVDDILKKGRKFYDWRNEPFISERQRAGGRRLLWNSGSCIKARDGREQGFKTPTELLFSGSRSGGVESPSERNIKALCLRTSAFFNPVEFSVAAYRFGHSQVRPRYSINPQFNAPIFGDPSDDLSGGRRIGEDKVIDWRRFYKIDGGTPQPSKRIDTTLSSPLFKLPFTGPNLPTNPNSLAQRNLLRHLTFSLPSGQAVAKAMCIEPLSKEELADVAQLGVGLEKKTPLWFYILREAGKRADGKMLGAVGGRIVAEVFIGILEGDRMSYLRQEPDWKPTLGTKEGEFSIVDLLKVAGVA